jgi:hypothetical protein
MQDYGSCGVMAYQAEILSCLIGRPTTQELKQGPDSIEAACEEYWTINES